MQIDDVDWKGVIRESYRIEGIRIEECRSIFLDWLISVRGEAEVKAQIRFLLDQLGPQNPDHPMTTVLTEGLKEPKAKGRRGGRRARVQP